MLICTFVLAAFSVLFAGCGGSNNSGFFPFPASTTTITGSVFAAPVDGANVTAKDSTGTVVGGPVKTLSDGTYSLDVPTSALSSDIIISSESGTFTDEATALPTAAGPMAAYLLAGGGNRIHINPISTILHALIMKGITPSAAQNSFGNGFGIMPDLATAPVPSTVSVTSDDATPRIHGLFAEAISRLAQSLGLTPAQQFALIAALAEDISVDGKLNGKNGLDDVLISGTTTTIPANIQLRMYQAIDMASRTALTPSYIVEYVPGMMAAKKGKTEFQIRIKKRSDDSAVSIPVSIKPMMHMLTMKHSTPADAVVEDSTTGTYNCTAYYSMSSVMSNNKASGYWELKVKIGTGTSVEFATFYPFVDMTMPTDTDTINATLYGTDDIMSDMSAVKYYLYSDGPVTAATPTFSLFISHGEMEGMMPRMNFVPLTIGAVMTAQTTTVVSNIDVLASEDNSTWINATNTSTGHWSIGGFPSLLSGQTGTIYVKMTVNGQAKSADGMGSSAQFKVTAQ